MTLFLFLSSLIITILLGMPVAFALLFASLVLMLRIDLFSVDILAQNMLNGVDSFPLLAIPFFLLAGEIMSVGGLSRRIVNLAIALMGHRRGGLGYVAIFTSMLLAGLSGSAVADAAALVSILYPMMRAANYPQGSSLGLLAAGGLIAPVIPPSLPMIILGVAGNISISKLFLGGIVPGLYMGLGLVIVWTFVSRKADTEVSPKASGSEKATAFRQSAFALMLPVIIIGGIRFGIFTPTEAAAVAAVYAIVISSLVYRELPLRAFYKCLVSAAKTTSMVMFLVGAAMVASWLITAAQLPQELGNLLAPLKDSPRLLMLVMVLILLLVGMVMDLAPTILVLVPLFLPLVRAAGIDPVYFGLIFVITTVIGTMTPPVGTVLSVVCGVSRAPMSTVVRGVAPFLATYMLLLLIFVMFPAVIEIPMKWIIG